MTIYYVGLFCIFALQYILDTSCQKINISRKKADQIWLAVTWIFLSVLAGLRAPTVGTDTFGYMKDFVEQNYSTGIEVGFQFLAKLSYRISTNPTFFLLVMSFLTNGLILLAIYRMSDQIYVSTYFYVFMYYYLNSFNAARQYVAIGLLLNCFYWMTRRDWVRYSILLLLALSFHITGIIGAAFLLVPFYEKYIASKGTKVTRLKELILGFLAIAVSFAAFDFLLNIVLYLIPKYRWYLNTDYMTKTGGIQQPVVYSAIFIAYCLFHTDESKHPIWFVPMVMTVVLSFLQLKLAYISRFLWCVDILSIFPIAALWKNNSLTRKTPSLLNFIMIAVGVAFLSYLLSVNMQSVNPYHFIFEESFYL